ncbi:MAG TPA: MFS transporter [Acidobacteriota bacterium]|nr:MFS transporter [Acidobacteriota bacterium]
MNQETLISQEGQLQRLSVLIAASCVDMIGFAMILPLLPFYALNLRASPAMIGLILSSFSVAQLLSAPMWGRVSDRYGRRPALLIGLAASAAAYLVFGFADAVWLLFASRIIQGAGGGTTGVAQAYVADTVPPENRARALGWLSAASSVGVMVGPAIGSFAAHWGQAAPGLVAAGLCLINVGFAWKWLPESKSLSSAGTAASRSRPAWGAAWMILRNPGGPVPRLIYIYAVGMLAFSMLTSVLSLYMGARFGFTEQTIGYVFLYVGLLSVVMRSMLLGLIVDRVGEAWTVRIGTFTLVIGLLAYPAAGTLWSLAAIIPFVPVGTALLFPSTTSLMSQASARSELGTTMGIAQTYAGIARMVAPVFATYVFQRFGHAMPFYAAAATVALVGILAFRINPAGGSATNYTNFTKQAHGS